MELERVFREFGYQPHRHDFYPNMRRRFRPFLYGFVEAGCPALLAFSVAVQSKDKSDRLVPAPEGHVVAVVGHTLSPDSWFPTAFAGYAGEHEKDFSYRSSLDWVDEFLIHDDNYGMQLSFPAHSFRPEDRPDPGSNFTSILGIGLYPDSLNVSLLNYEVEDLVAANLHELCESLYKQGSHVIQPYYIRHFLPHLLRYGTAVFRTVLVTREQYMRHLSLMDNDRTPFGEREKRALQAILKPHPYFWLVEVTEPDLYVGNRSKLIDVLFAPDSKYSPSQAHRGIILARLPGFLLVPSHNSREYQIKSRLSVLSHYPLLTFD